MKSLIVKSVQALRCGRWAAWRAGVLGLLWLFAVVPVWAAGEPNDPLLLPAVKSSKAASSVLMDVVNTGNRLVAVGARGHVLFSDDHGANWSQATVPVSITLTAVSFPTAQQGWAVGHEGVILHSSDGGKSWVKQLDGSQINQLVLAQVDQILKVKKAELDSAGDGAVSALKNKVEDLQYFRNDAKMAVEEGPTRPFMDVWFKNDHEGIVVGSFGMILATQDGGKHWQPILESIDNPDGYHYYGLSQAGKRLFIDGEMGMLFRSEDDGRHWERLASPYEGSFFGMTASPEGKLVVAYGLRGHVFRSTDGGDSWQQAKVPETVSMQGGTILGDGSVWLIGSDGTLFRSLDDGLTFTSMPVSVPGGVSVVEDGDSLVVVGLQGVKRIAKSDLPK